jgi:pyruvate dehydrogenase E1 component alpha subunit
MPGQRVDGNEVEAVFEAAGEAAARANEGAGPSLLECVSYRWEPHSIFTRRETRPQQEIEEWKLKDPIARYRRFLTETKEATTDELGEIDSEVQAEAAKASVFATTSPTPAPESADQDVYA